MRCAALHLLALPLTVLLSGCPVWSDSSGTGPCVGLGCACFDDSECGRPLVCDDGRCALPPGACLDDRDCDADERCERDSCVPDVAPPTTCRIHGDCPAGERCSDDGECVQSARCADGMCMESGDECDFRDTCVPRQPGACRGHAGCAADELCVEDFCRPATETCQFNYECGPGRACRNGGCTPICANADDCGEGSTCDEGFCRPDDGQCATSDDCDGGESCVGGRCLSDCAATGRCDGANLCDLDNFCRPDWTRQPICTPETVEDDCAAGSVCVEGACRTPCASGTNDECMMTDPVLSVCSENLCFTATESEPECADERDCSGDDACIDASCR